MPADSVVNGKEVCAGAIKRLRAQGPRVKAGERVAWRMSGKNGGTARREGLDVKGTVVQPMAVGKGR